MGDLIDRQSVLDIIEFEDKWLLDANGHNKDTEIAFSGLKTKISDLPSVQPKAKDGHWIEMQRGYLETPKFECSECGKIIYAEKENYCPKCGKRMVDE